MTLIAAFRCDADGHQGVVICADSQETVDNQWRVDVTKIKPRDAGEYDLVIGGSGQIGTLIDGLADKVGSNVKRWPAGLSEEEAKQRVEQVLLGYYARQVALYPAQADEKLLRFLICVKGKSSSEIFLWKTDGTAIESVGDWVLFGWEEAAYHYEVKWLYRRGLRTAQAILLGIHLFTVAQNSMYIGKPTQVIVVRDNGMHPQVEDDIRVLEERVTAFNQTLAQIVLSCPDTSIHQEEFRGFLLQFVDEAIRMREYYMTQMVAQSIGRALTDPNYSGDAYPIVPVGQSFAVHIDNPETMEKLREMIRKNNERLKREREANPPSDSQTSEGQP